VFARYLLERRDFFFALVVFGFPRRNDVVDCARVSANEFGKFFVVNEIRVICLKHWKLRKTCI